jgi:hypothetical protein
VSNNSRSQRRTEVDQIASIRQLLTKLVRRTGGTRNCGRLGNGLIQTVSGNGIEIAGEFWLGVYPG